MSDEQCGADPFENGYDEKLSEKEYRERIKYLMRCHDDSTDEIERLRAEVKEQQLNIVTLGQEVGRLRENLLHIVEAWDWWQVDTYDRCQSVPSDAINEARAALAETEKTNG